MRKARRITAVLLGMAMVAGLTACAGSMKRRIAQRKVTQMKK